MIQVQSFEEWDKDQPVNNIIEWGSTDANKDSQMRHNSIAYNSAPIEIKRMLYNQYVHQLTNPASNL